jgi:putative ABC transport system permease protein
MGSLLQDLKYGIRMLAKNPGFTAIAVLTLALGIGANTAIFSAANAILLRPLPYKDSARLVNVWSTLSYFPDFNLGDSPADLADIKAGNHVFEQMATYRTDTMNLTGGGDPEEASVGRISSELFQMLGTRPAMGRSFIGEEEQPERGKVVILSDAVWRRRFGRDANIVGKTITLNEKPYQVVGVAPPDFRFPPKTDLWVPLALTDKELHDREFKGTLVLAKLKRGANVKEAQAEMAAIATRLGKQYPDEDSELGLKVELLQEATVGRTRIALLVLLGAVGFVLLIACANVGNLALARGFERQREMGIRASLGANRHRIIRLLLAESLLLAIAGGMMGLLFAWWGIDALRLFAPANTPRLDELRLEPGILWPTLAISIFAGILFGLFPALQSSCPDLNAILKEGGGSASSSLRRSRLRSAFVVTEVALALVLLAGAALTIRSFSRLTHVNPGFRTDHLLSMRVKLPDLKYHEAAQRIDFVNQALEKIGSLAGVESAAANTTPILNSLRLMSTVTIEGAPAAKQASADSVDLNSVTPGFFQVIGMRLLAGRSFTGADVQGAPRVAVINEAMSRRYWPNGNVVGKRLSVEQDKSLHPIWLEIVGVVNDTRDVSLNAAPKPEIYLPFFQHAYTFLNFYLRTLQDTASLAPAAQSQIWAVDHAQPVSALATMDVTIAQDVAEPRFRTLLLGVFAALGLALTVIGIYGVISYSVSRRTHEIGIRMALGAGPRDVLQNVLWDGLKLTLAGLAIGLAAALALTRLLASLLFEIRATDPLTFGAVSVLLAGVAMAACYVPARRATKVDPLVALRHE